MPDDNEPLAPNNPFIRFKKHVNTRIGTAFSAFTSNTHDRTDKPLDGSQRCANERLPTNTMALGGLREHSSGIGYWNTWSQIDPYSPYNLRHLRQPTPRDLPSDIDPAYFGFHDAFEDLMSASGPSGGPLMDLRERAQLKKSILDRFASGEPPIFWVNRLHRDALLPPPLMWEHAGLFRGPPGYRDQGQKAKRPDSMREWAEEKHKAFQDASGAEQDRRLAAAVQEILDKAGRLEPSTISDLFSGLEEMLGQSVNVADMARKAWKAFDEASNAIRKEFSEDYTSGGSGRTNTRGDAKPAPSNGEDQPATEQDLFQMVSFALSEVDKSFNNFAKSMMAEASPPTERTRAEKPRVREVVEYDASGGKTVKTVSEYVDMLGFVHSKNELRRLDAKGEEVGYETYHTVRSADDALRDDQTRQEVETERRNGLSHGFFASEQLSTSPRDSSNEKVNTARVSTASNNEEEMAEKSQDKPNRKSSGWFWR